MTTIVSDLAWYASRVWLALVRAIDRALAWHGCPDCGGRVPCATCCAWGHR